MITLPYEAIQQYRRATFQSDPDRRVTTPEAAVEFCNRRGYILFWPHKEIAFPSLWAAAAGDRPVPDEHDDPGHVTWGWKDALLDKKVWYYARVLHGRNAMIALDVAPYFYALTENYGEPESDYLIQYEEGRMTAETRQVYEALLKAGPLDTLSLRKEARLSSNESSGRFNKAINELMADFKILPVGIAEVGAWRYAYRYDVTHRMYPGLLEQARFINEWEARRVIAGCYFRSLGAGTLGDLGKLTGWNAATVKRVIEGMVKAGTVVDGIEVPGRPGKWAANSAFLSTD